MEDETPNLVATYKIWAGKGKETKTSSSFAKQTPIDTLSTISASPTP